MPAITILLNHDNSALLHATDKQVQILEGNYYLQPNLIDLNKFEISDRVYNCPIKGKCLWVDLNTELGWLNNFCWIYPEPKPAFKHIAGWFGFYPTHKNYEIKQ